jgi:hypothetical protein
MGDSIPFWTDLMNHGSYDSWWKARNVRNFIKDVKPATLWLADYLMPKIALEPGARINQLKSKARQPTTG